jgi:hypothetical protein
MGREESIEKLALYLQKNLQMLPATSKMAARRYIAEFCTERAVEDIGNGHEAEFGKWLAGEFSKTGLVKKDLIARVEAEFRVSNYG